ncbi:hypothetical protein AVEN_253613-1 [Araneus ventricosus]|uniref:Uncharacterized protein n=1 Tax=Araneus ventricosus TaxID=182803 RepID=A0A4Y2CA29_ARAVE|nr:hypothetical protein AVEN_253613-1 [Araneus ventricosus]
MSNFQRSCLEMVEACQMQPTMSDIGLDYYTSYWPISSSRMQWFSAVISVKGERRYKGRVNVFFSEDRSYLQKDQLFETCRTAFIKQARLWDESLFIFGFILVVENL